MAIYELLTKIDDLRKGGSGCEFNGYLEDYLETIADDHKLKPLFRSLFELENDLKIIVNLRVSISKDSISNQIIRYKDIFKLENDPIRCGYIVYLEKDQQERALLIYDGEYAVAKGIYYTMTEPFNTFQPAKNEMVAISTGNDEHIISVFKRLFVYRAGGLQREIDRKNFSTYSDIKERILKYANELKETVYAQLEAANEEDYENIIINHIVQWYLIKKFLYVQFMVNKDILKNEFEGNVKKQRNQAKINADQVPFVSFSEMWKSTMIKNKQLVSEEQ